MPEPATMFPCPLCGGGEPDVAGVCTACAERIVDAYRGPATEDEFEAWWKLYPRKIGKDAAREKYRKARKRASAEELAQAVTLYARIKSETEPEYIAHPATWLSHGRWKDEHESPVQMVDMDRKRVEDFVRSGFWLSSWGPKPTEPDADPRVRRLYEEARA